VGRGGIDIGGIEVGRRVGEGIDLVGARVEGIDAVDFDAILRAAARARRSPIGDVVARVPVGGVPGRGGRPAWGVLDVGTLTPVSDAMDDSARDAALVRLAGLSAAPVTPVLETAASVSVDRLRDIIPVLVDAAGVLDISPVPRREGLAVGDLAATLAPSSAIRSALRGRLRVTDAIADRVFRPERLRRIMAAPSFPRPMYQALHDYDEQWLVPGMGLLPADDFVTILSTNPQFMEAFLIGLSDEMGRELLWRNYPTDQSGTYFRRFWDRDEDELRQPIHAFARSQLGSHISFGGDGGNDPRAVIVVKSELVRRYPDVIIQAVKNHGTREAPQFDGPQAVIAKELFSALLPPDTALIGIDLSPDELEDPGNEWWITISEHPTATRFGRPSNLAGDFVMQPDSSGAEFAKAHLHDPIRVAFRAPDLLETT
jgi:hypothetical protein